VGNTAASPAVKSRTREEELEDMLATVGQTFLGMTVQCARCHNHKFDPIPQRDYYRLKAVFDGIRFGDRPILTSEQKREQAEAIARIHQEIADLEKSLQAIERAAREKVLRERGETKVDGLPEPMARWCFQGDARDAVGSLHGELRGGAMIANGR